MKTRVPTIIGVIFLIIAAALVGVILFLTFGGDTPEYTFSPVISSEPEPEETVEPAADTTEEDIPVDKLVITPERKQYSDGDLTLCIPQLSLICTVNNGTGKDALRNGVGLYDYAQLPGEGNRNVSIAGHRNNIVNGKITDAAPFYYIDTIGEGDYLYLVSSDYIYRYLYESTYIVEEDDWSPIRTTGYSCLTLTSCHPIGISDHRIILRGILDEVVPFDENYDYLANSKEVLK